MEEDFKEYVDEGDQIDYEKPERHTENEQIEIRLYCNESGCNVYIKGIEGYNGGFVAETGQYADLRNQCFICSKHRNKRIRLSKRPRSSTG